MKALSTIVGSVLVVALAAGAVVAVGGQQRDRKRDGSCVTTPSPAQPAATMTQQRDRLRDGTCAGPQIQQRDRKQDGSCQAAPATCSGDREQIRDRQRDGTGEGARIRDRKRDGSCGACPYIDCPCADCDPYCYE